MTRGHERGEEEQRALGRSGRLLSKPDKLDKTRGILRLLRSPIRYREEPADYTAPSARLGEHNEQIRKWISVTLPRRDREAREST